MWLGHSSGKKQARKEAIERVNIMRDVDKLKRYIDRRLRVCLKVLGYQYNDDDDSEVDGDKEEEGEGGRAKSA